MLAESKKIIELRTANELEIAKVTTPCEMVTAVNHELAIQIAADLKATLMEKLPPEHNKPAYLAANQIGDVLNVLVLYLPQLGSEEKYITLINPKVTGLKEFSEEEKAFSISTFFADQFRFANINYNKAVSISYLDENGNNASMVLQGNDAIAAQMGVNFTRGQTPFESGISLEELKKFVKRTQEKQLESPSQYREITKDAKIITLWDREFPAMNEGEKIECFIDKSKEKAANPNQIYDMGKLIMRLEQKNQIQEQVVARTR